MTVTAGPGPRVGGRPRSEHARQAVLQAVDDLLVDVGYGAMTMKGIAERAGVGRQTVYRWWTSKAEILVEACATDAAEELTTRARADAAADLMAYLTALSTFLTRSPAGLAYLALVGEAQHDPGVRQLLREADLLAPAATAVLERVRESGGAMPETRLAVAQLTGPLISQILTGAGKPLPPRLLRSHVETLLHGWRADRRARSRG